MLTARSANKYDLILRFVLDEIAHASRRFDERMAARDVKLTMGLHWMKGHVEKYYHPHTRADFLARKAACEGHWDNGLTEDRGNRPFALLTEHPDLPSGPGEWRRGARS